MSIAFDSWHMQPAFLEEDERKEPVSALQSLCRGHALHDKRSMLWNIFHAAFGSDTLEDDTPLQKANLFYDFIQMIKLHEAAFLIHQQIEEGKLIVSYKQ
jgi:hypothetical protein